MCVRVHVHVCREGEDRLPLLSDPRVSLMTNGTLMMSDITRDDNGVYTCSVKHINISISAHLEVYSESQPHTHREGERVELYLRPNIMKSFWDVICMSIINVYSLVNSVLPHSLLKCCRAMRISDDAFFSQHFNKT